MTALAKLDRISGPIKAGVTLAFAAERARLLHRLLAPTRLTRVVDIGANPAHPPPYAPLLDLGMCEVWGFEPDPGAHARLQRRKGPHEHYRCEALGDGATHELHRFAFDTLNSLLPPNTERNTDCLGQFTDALRLRDKIPCQTRRLDDITDMPPPDLLKIDIQGAENLVFSHAQQTLSATGAIIAEVAFAPVYHGQPLIGETMALLSRQGFAFHRMAFAAHYPIGSPLLDRLAGTPIKSQAIDGDAIFLREAYLTDGAAPPDPERLRHLALLADTVLGSVDVTCRLLWLLDRQAGLDPDLLTQYLDLLQTRQGAAVPPNKDH